VSAFNFGISFTFVVVVKDILSLHVRVHVYTHVCPSMYTCARTCVHTHMCPCVYARIVGHSVVNSHSHRKSSEVTHLRSHK
jgi:hypothetical protein